MATALMAARLSPVAAPLRHAHRLDPNTPYYFKVAATNAGGESKASEVVTALPSGGIKQVLIVNGFDRFDRTQNFRYAYLGGLVDRVSARYNNSFDYVIQVHTAINASRAGNSRRQHQ